MQGADLEVAAAKTRCWRTPSQNRRPLSLGVFHVWLPITNRGESVSQPPSAALSSGNAPLRHSKANFTSAFLLPLHVDGSVSQEQSKVQLSGKFNRLQGTRKLLQGGAEKARQILEVCAAENGCPQYESLANAHEKGILWAAGGVKACFRMS